MQLDLKFIDDRHNWNSIVKTMPYPHLLQSWEWGEFKSRQGWQAKRLLWSTPSGDKVAAAQLLERKFGALFSVLYIPRGPLLDWSDAELRRAVLLQLKKVAAASRAIFMKIDPGVILNSKSTSQTENSSKIEGEIPHALQESDFRFSAEQIQFRNTFALDLSTSEDELLAAMKQKTRYNIRLAGRKGVSAHLGTDADFDLLYRMYAETSLRDRFAIRDQAYYVDVWGSFHYAGLAHPMIAVVEGEPVAALILYRFGNTVWYLYGMSRNVHREKMPNYLLQWEAIRWAKAVGCTTYDFWGAPDTQASDDPMAGVSRFKSGFGAPLIETPGAWDNVLQPATYWVYQFAIPKLLSLLRKRGGTRTQQSLE